MACQYQCSSQEGRGILFKVNKKKAVRQDTKSTLAYENQKRKTNPTTTFDPQPF